MFASRIPVLSLVLSFLVLSLAMTLIPLSCNAQEHHLRVRVIDAHTGEPLPARLTLKSDSNHWYYFTSDAPSGSAVTYTKQNWINKQSIENHTTVSAHSCSSKVPRGHFELTIEHGKEYLPNVQRVTVEDKDVDLEVALQHWCNPQQRGWYSGDTHLHRTVDDLQTVILAEDLNVALPLTNWVTIADQPPKSGNKNLTKIPDGLVSVDSNHVIWPRNTEYEIFSVGGQRHTLGALFVLGHRRGLDLGVPPWTPVVESVKATDPNVLFDMDKLDWPFAMVLPTVVPNALYELSNNHVWKTPFAFRTWNTRAPAYIQPPFGASQGGHRQWIDYTMGMYYTFLNCGFRMPPTAGTANGVHPVPAGFGRVYVRQSEGFDYQGWMKGLGKGRSFVTTGPMLFATAEENDPGHVFVADHSAEIPVKAEVLSEKRLSYGELLINGRPEILLRPQNTPQDTGGFRSEFESVVSVSRSTWFALRFWEPRPDGQSRFVHSAPWYVEIGKQPVQPRGEEKRFLIRRMEEEMRRSRGIVPEAAMQEYERALSFYRLLPEYDDSAEIKQESRPAASHDDEQRWLDNMIIDHHFDIDEVRRATGLSNELAKQAIEQRSEGEGQNGFRILPYPGGRHPRIGFLDGAIRPQRETKVSIFPPWENGGYVVVDVPEAVFSNLGLTYLAHEHIPTIWSDQSIELPRLEWQRSEKGLSIARKLPNGITIAAKVTSDNGAAKMQLTLKNGTTEKLTGLRVQVCVMLKGTIGFNVQEPLETIARPPYVAIRGENSDRWIITAWQPNHRVWTNPPVPCMHSDPIFPDCHPGETVRVDGALWFYEGMDVEAEIQRIDSGTEDQKM